MDLNRKKETILTDFVRFSWKATRGLLDQPENHVPYWSDRLQRTEKMTPEQVQKIASFIEERMIQANKRFMATVDQSVVDTVTQIADLTVGELKTIEDKLDRIAKRIENLK